LSPSRTFTIAIARVIAFVRIRPRYRARDRVRAFALAIARAVAFARIRV
jgi:hypothetical protein